MKRFIRRSNRLRRSQSNEPFFGKENNEAGVSGPEKASPFFNQLPAQTKLSIGKPNDKYEQQADAMADQVVNKKTENDSYIHRQEEEEAQASIQKQGEEEEEALQTSIQKQEEEEEAQASIQRQGEEEEEALQTSIQKQEEEEAQTSIQKQGEEEEEALQAQSKSCACQAPNSLEVQLKQSKGSGQSLPATVRKPMESAFKADFSSVRIHTDSSAVKMNKQLHAYAFTHGKDIYFNAGQYQPQNKAGQHLLAHELTHTLQQGAVRKIRKRSMPRFSGTPLGTYQYSLPSMPGQSTTGQVSATHELVLSQEEPGTFNGFPEESIARNLARQNVGQVTAVLRDNSGMYHTFSTNLPTAVEGATTAVEPVTAGDQFQVVRMENTNPRSTEVNRDSWVARVNQAFQNIRNNQTMLGATRLAQLLSEATEVPLHEIHVMESAEDKRAGINMNVHLTGAYGRGGISRLPADRTTPIPIITLQIGQGAFYQNSPEVLRATFVHELTHYAQAKRSADLLRSWRATRSRNFESWLNQEVRANRVTTVERDLTLGFIHRNDNNTESLAHLNAFMHAFHQLPLTHDRAMHFRSLFSFTEHWPHASEELRDRTVAQFTNYYHSLPPNYQEYLSQYTASMRNNTQLEPGRRLAFEHLDESIR